ncbi:MAG: hypothetical protein H6Q05_1493 [Acidobacteria bacterium]|nr:hypothetical protein [Acidobacteriota bacterium]
MRTFRFWLAWFLSLILFLVAGLYAGPVFQETTAPEKLIAAAEELVPVVAKLRGLEPKAPIRKGVAGREELAKALNDVVNRQYEKNELRLDGLLLKKLGFIPQDMDYAAFAVKLLVEQVGGYYDPEKKTLFLASWLPVDQQKPVMVHELTHALQDQHFDLSGMMDRDRKSRNDDMVLAHQAFVEGDATAVMLDYLLSPSGKTFLQLPDLSFIMRAQTSLMETQFEVLRSAPEYLKETLLFPYGYGASFLQKVRANDVPWSEVNRIYSDMPASTEQILHPDKYLGERDAPKQVTVPDPTAILGKEWQPVYHNVLGEFSIYLLLKLHLQEEAARNSAAGWGGDHVILVEDSGGKRSAVFADCVWDTQEAADRFYAAMSTWLERRYPKARKTAESDSGFDIIASGECHSLRRQGVTVRLIIGLPESYAGKFSRR